MKQNELTVAGLPSTFAVVRSLLKEMSLDLSPAGEKYVADTWTGRIKITNGPSHRVTVRDDTQLNPEVDLRERLNLLVVERKELFLAGPANGVQESEAGNPWSNASWSLTRQYILENTDPEKARQLQEVAR